METMTDLRLKDILKHSFENVHLVHSDIDMLPPTIVELSEKTLTDAGRQEWADILNARVLRVYNGLYGLQIECSDVKASRLIKFAAMLAGYCSLDEYDRWVSPSGRE